MLFRDEPFSALDYPTRKALLNEMGEHLKAMNMAALFVTHDYTEILFLASYVYVLFDGKIMKKGMIGFDTLNWLFRTFGEDSRESPLQGPL